MALKKGPFKIGERRYYRDPTGVSAPITVIRLRVPQGEKIYLVEEVGHMYRSESIPREWKQISEKEYYRKIKNYEQFTPDIRYMSGEELEDYV